MKKTLLLLACSLFVSAALAVDIETITTTMTATGTVTEYTPSSSLVIKEPSGSMAYQYGKKVVFATKSGKTLKDDEAKTLIKVGTPVTVTYVKEGEKRMLSRVEIPDN